jgi:hypothetical protein
MPLKQHIDPAHIEITICMRSTGWVMVIYLVKHQKYSSIETAARQYDQFIRSVKTCLCLLRPQHLPGQSFNTEGPRRGPGENMSKKHKSVQNQSR